MFVFLFVLLHHQGYLSLDKKSWKSPLVLVYIKHSKQKTHCSKSSFFCPKIQLGFPEKIVDFFGQKTRENVVVLDFLFLPVDNFILTRKLSKKIGVKTRENVRVLSKLNFWRKK